MSDAKDVQLSGDEPKEVKEVENATEVESKNEEVPKVGSMKDGSMKDGSMKDGSMKHVPTTITFLSDPDEVILNDSITHEEPKAKRQRSNIVLQGIGVNYASNVTMNFYSK